MSINEAWNFPDFYGGQTHGVDGDSAVSTFIGTALPSLAKEVIQNSLDAREDKTKPVVVKFSVFDIPTESLPGRDDLYAAIVSSKARNYDPKSGNERIKVFFERAIATLTGKTINIMQISDSNTTGLTNPDADIVDDEQARNSRWLGCVHGMGKTDKGGVSGGSHGQGKSAALSNSSIRTLFYATRDKALKEGFQGVAFVGTHKKPNGNTLSQSVGYYGIPDEKNSAILQCRSLNPAYTRKEPGTDIFVAGFENLDHWEETLLVAVLNDYLIPLWKNELVVYIGDSLVVSKDALDNGIFDKYREAYEAIDGKAKDNFADKCYAAIKEPDYHTEPEDVDFYGIHGTVEVYLKTGIGYPKSVAMVREIGMKVFDKQNLTSAMQYVGVMYIRGEELNSFLARLENVQHTSWDVEPSAVDAKETKQKLNALYRYLNNIIRSLLDQATSGHMEVDGLEEFFGIDFEDKDEAGQAKKIDTPIIASISAKTIPTYSTTEQYYITNKDGSLEDYAVPGDKGEQPTEPEPKPGPEPEPDPAPKPSLGPDDTPSEEDPLPEKQEQDDEQKERKDPVPISLTKKALIGGKRGTGEYTLVLECKDNRKAKVGIFLAGEETDETPVITTALNKTTGESLSIKDNYFLPVILPAKTMIRVSFTLAEKIPCALGVKVYAY